MVIVSNECIFIRKLSGEFRHFRVFVFYYWVYSKTRNPWKIFISSFSEAFRLFIWFRAFLWAFYVIRKSKWYLDNKLIALQQFSSDGKPLTLGVFWFRKISDDFWRFRDFVFYRIAYSKTRNPWKILFLLFFDVRFLPDIII